jgi:hypothetical protein
LISLLSLSFLSIAIFRPFLQSFRFSFSRLPLSIISDIVLATECLHFHSHYFISLSPDFRHFADDADLHFELDGYVFAIISPQRIGYAVTDYRYASATPLAGIFDIISFTLTPPIPFSPLMPPRH